ncbi:hypothetical protein [Longimicrobium sp.]|jgi:hypothetical protein|uniref:hypothetical protein n=1 Tax=Longimicrobium sp. TaxID=2029185 RepID=UPI002ED91D57
MFALLTLPRGRVSPRRAATLAPDRADPYGIVIRLPRAGMNAAGPGPAPLMTADVAAD